MAEPTKWALERAREIFQSDKSYGFVWNTRLANEIAIVLDEARRQGIEEAAQSAQRQQINPPYTAAGFQSMIVGEILSLTAKEPTDG